MTLPQPSGLVNALLVIYVCIVRNYGNNFEPCLSTLARFAYDAEPLNHQRISS